MEWTIIQPRLGLERANDRSPSPEMAAMTVEEEEEEEELRKGFW